jgi:8-oxo-dGTP pyrophosphatase MutT (NUDIX family)
MVELPMGRMSSVQQQRGDWTVLDSQRLYASPWITVREDRVIQPDGLIGTFGVVEMTPGVSILPLGEDGTVYLVRVFRYTLGRDSIETAAGGIEDGESPEETAHRELREELGIEAREIIPLGIVDQLTENVVSPDHLFLARGLTFVAPNHEPTERITRIAVPLEQALQWALDGTISHAASTTLIFKAVHLNQR